LLVRLAEKLDVDARDLMPTLASLAGREERNSGRVGSRAFPGGVE
jgi:hypothetical protein